MALQSTPLQSFPNNSTKRRMNLLSSANPISTMSSNMAMKTSTPALGATSLSVKAPTSFVPTSGPFAPVGGQSRPAQSVQPVKPTQTVQPVQATVTRFVQPMVSQTQVAQPVQASPVNKSLADAARAKRAAVQAGPVAKNQQQTDRTAQQNALAEIAQIGANETPATPTTTATPTLSQNQQDYLNSLEKTQEELDLEQRISDLTAQQESLSASEQLGLANIEDQPIPMQFITGQQASVQRQAAARQAALTAQSQPLLNQLALLQAQREMAQTRALKQQEFAQAQAEAQKGEIKELNGSLYRVLPDGTVSTLVSAPSTAEQFTLSPGQIRYDSAGNPLAMVPETIDEYKNGIDALNYQIKQVELDQKMKDLGSNVLTDADIKNIDASPQGKKLITLSDLGRSIRGYRTLVDEYGRGIINPSQRSLLNNAWSDVAIKWKEAAALGALTGPDIELVEKNIPQATGFGLQGKGTIISVLDQSLNKLKQDTTSAYNQLVSRNPKYAESEYVRGLAGQIEENNVNQNPLLSVQYIDPIPLPQSFNKVGNDTNTVAKIANSIGQFESGGNYQARGPVVTSGMYKGERALGKYQIMPGNLPSWSKEALGYVVTPEQFLQNPQIQDAIAQNKMGKILQQYGTVEDVASVWFSGRPVAKAGNAKDVLGTTVPKYVQNVVSIYNS